VKRREFIALLGGAAATWPLAARAQQPERMRRIGVLLSTAADDPESSARTASFLQGLQQLGWIEGRNLRIDIRWAAGDAELYRKYAAELVALAPDIILASSSPTVAALQAATRTVPIVFAHAVDPVGAGFVDSLARPGGNATGFVLFEYGISAKWLELLKEIAPALKRVAVLRDPTTAAGMGQFGAIQSVAPSFGMEVNPVSLRDPGEIERGVTAFAASPNGGLIITAAPLGTLYRELIIALAARHKLPAIYSSRFFAADGGLVYYGPDLTDQYRRAAGYIDRILKGEKPANLAVQAPTKYEMAINLKTAKTLGIEVRRRCSPAPTRCSSETARVHRAARRRGGRLAARGASAALAPHRRTHRRCSRRCRCSNSVGSASAGTAAIRLDRGP
jgi:putative tryptophan/tyrosine transport system substrate-binding protein